MFATVETLGSILQFEPQKIHNVKQTQKEAIKQ